MGKRKKRERVASGDYRKNLSGYYQREEGNYNRGYYPVPSSSRDDLSQAARNLKVYVGYGVLGVGVATGLFLGVRYLIRKSRAQGSEKKSTEAGNPATYAKLLRMAFDNDNMLGWGTDEDMVFQVIEEIPSQAMYAKVQKEYAAQNSGKSLNADLSSELSSEDYQKVIGLLNSKPN